MGVSKMEVESIDNPRIHLPRDKRQKALELLGTTESKITLMKTLGMSASEVESAIAEVELANTARCREKNDQAILNKINSKKDSKCLDRLGINLSIPRLQKQFGISEEELELAGWIHSDGKLVNIPESEDNDSNEEKLEDED